MGVASAGARGMISSLVLSDKQLVSCSAVDRHHRDLERCHRCRPCSRSFR